MVEKLIRGTGHKEDLLKLTDYEKKAWQGAKDMGWFDPELTCWYADHKSWEGHYLVRRGYYVATRLYDKGYFERRLVGEYPFLVFEFRYFEPNVTKGTNS